MKQQSAGSFFTRIRQKLFEWGISREIFGRMFPHLEHEKNCGYPFQSDAEMEAQTKAFDAKLLLAAIEARIRRMPKAYGKSFRHIMHRDLQKRLRMYEEVARRNVQPETFDPRFIATRAV